MKNSEHRQEHLRKKAVKQANNQESSLEPKDLIENPEFKKKFDANYKKKLPHKKHHHCKKTSKRTCTDEVKESTEPAHLQHQSERWNTAQIVKSEEKNNRMNHKDHHYKK